MLTICSKASKKVKLIEQAFTLNNPILFSKVFITFVLRSILKNASFILSFYKNADKIEFMPQKFTAQLLGLRNLQKCDCLTNLGISKLE